MKDLGGDSSYYVVDVSNSVEVKETIDLIMSKMGRVDILVNNVGIGAFGKIEDVTDELLDKVLEVNFKSAFYLCGGVVSIIKKQFYGKIVNISSITCQTR